MIGDGATADETSVPAAARLAQEIGRLRKVAGLSQPELAGRIGYTRQYVSMAERVGKNIPSQELVRALDKVLDANGALIALHQQAKAEQVAVRQNASAAESGRPDGYPMSSPGPQRSASSGAVAERRCAACGTVLAADNTARLCSSCYRGKHDVLRAPPTHLPDEFFETNDFRAAFSSRHIGKVFKAYRNHPRHLHILGKALNQEQLGRWLGLNQGQVSKIESAPKPEQDIELLQNYAAILRLPQRLLWFDLPGQSRLNSSRSSRGTDGMFVSSVTADFSPAAVDIFAKVDLAVEPGEFLNQISIETPVPGQIGWSDVEHIRSTTRAVATAENVFGGGLSCEAAMGQLRWAGKLLDARADNDVRRAMFEAVGNLSSVVAYSAFDVSAYEAADRCFHLALWCSDQSGSWALRANTLAEMSRKAAYLGDLDDALSMIEFAQVRSDRLTNTARAMLCTLRARLLALTSRHSEARSDISRADAHFHEGTSDLNPPWLTYYDIAEHQGSIGKALIPIAQAEQNVDIAAPRLRDAIELHRENYPRSRAFSRTRLATLAMDIGDPHEAVAIGRQLLDEVAPLRSDRVTSELRGLARVSDRYSQIGDVKDLRHDILALTPPKA